MLIAVLGCGPAGLLTALAVEQAGHDPVILSKKVQSEMHGAMYLHRPIPDATLPSPDDQLAIRKTGTAEGYAYKVYGDKLHPVSFTQFDTGFVGMWSLRAAYERLWERFESRIFNVNLDPATLHQLAGNYPTIFSTIPKTSVCRNHEHKFTGQRIFVRQLYHQKSHALGNVMEYNGDYAVPWYRYSRILGWEAWEHSEASHTPNDLKGWYTGTKPLTNNCDCWESFHWLGRFGRWEKGQLTHHAYEQAQEVLRAL